MKKILIIEDDLVLRENTVELLELSGYEVCEASNGKIGVECAKTFSPDLILCDIMMPEMDGLEVLSRLGRLPATSQIPFIFLTAKADKSDFRKGMSLGADDYLTKPFEGDDLLDAIDMRLKKYQSLKSTKGDSHSDILEFFDKASDIVELSESAKSFKGTKVSKKQILFSEGDKPQYIFYLISGKLKVFKNHADGKEYIVEVISDSAFCGVTNFISLETYSSSCVAIEDSIVAKLPIEDFTRLILANREVSAQFIKLLAQRVEAKEEQLMSFAYDTVRLRIAKALVELSEKADSEVIKITREDLAALTGTTTETVIRSLSDFKKDGLIESIGRQIKILDKNLLSTQDY